MIDNQQPLVLENKKTLEKEITSIVEELVEECV
jgi:hypothetical protein